MERPNRTKETRLSVFVNEQELFIDQLEAEVKAEVEKNVEVEFKLALKIVELEAENKELKDKIKRVDGSLMSDRDLPKINDVNNCSYEVSWRNGVKHQRDLTLKALEG